MDCSNFSPFNRLNYITGSPYKNEPRKATKNCSQPKIFKFDGIFSAAGAVSLFPWFIGCVLVVARNAHKARMLRHTRGLVFASSAASATTFLLSWYLFLSGVAFNNRLW